MTDQTKRPIITVALDVASRMATEARRLAAAVETEAEAPDAITLTDEDHATLNDALRDIRVSVANIEMLLRLADSPTG